MPTLGGAIQLRELGRLELRLHQALDEILVAVGRQEVAALLVPFGVAQHAAVDVGVDVGELADVAVEGDVRQLDLERDADLGDHLVPAADADIAVGDVVVAQPHVERRQRRRVLVLDLAVDQPQHRIGAVLQLMVVVEPVLAIAALQAGVEGVGGVGRNLVAEQIERQREVQVRLLLDGRQVDDAELAHFLDLVRVGDAGLLHRLAGALDDAGDAGLAHEHVVRFFGQHEAAGARQRIEARLRQRLELHLAVAVGEDR